MTIKNRIKPLPYAVATALLLSTTAATFQVTASEHNVPRVTAEDVGDPQKAPRPEDQNTPWSGDTPEKSPGEVRAEEREKDAIVDERDDSAEGERRSVGEFVDDSVITTRVKYALVQNDELDGFDINVDTREGVVILSGEVDTEAKRDLAVKVAEGIDDVREVRHDGLMVMR